MLIPKYLHFKKFTYEYNLISSGCTNFLLSAIVVSSINLRYLMHKIIFILLLLFCSKMPAMFKLWRVLLRKVTFSK